MISLNKYGLKINLNIAKIFLNLHIYKTPKTARAIGIRNHTPEGKRLAFLDYDCIMLEEQLIPELQYFQEKYFLSDFYIFKSSQKPNAYHVICLDKMNANEFMALLIESGCDERYKTTALNDFKSWVLRISKKGTTEAPTYLRTIKSQHNNRIKSKAHAKFLKLQYGINIKKFINLDNNEILPVVAYNTISNIDGEGN